MNIITSEHFHNYYDKNDPEFAYSGIVETDSSWHQKPIYASYSRLYYITDGSGFLYSNTDKILLEPGYVYLAPCGSECGFLGAPSVTKLFFHFNLLLFNEELDAFDGFGHFARLPRPIEYINRLENEYKSNSSISLLHLKSELTATIFEFLQMEDKPKNNVIKHSDALVRALKYIRNNLNAKLSAKDVAEAALCSSSKLALIFSKEIGKPVSKYIEDLIMSEAQTMLLYTDASIGEISDKLGFYDQFYFSRRFKKHFATSPTKYRNSTYKS